MPIGVGGSPSAPACGMLGGTRVEAAKKLAEALNEHVLNMFVGVGEKST